MFDKIRPVADSRGVARLPWLVVILWLTAMSGALWYFGFHLPRLPWCGGMAE
jgi:hypothetical protein